MQIIARIRSDFPTKFGIPRQSGLVDELEAAVVFEPEFRNPDAVRGLDGFSHLWLIWQCSAAVRDTWSPTVRPPRLGGNTRMGVFATRSPYRPNKIGLTVVRLLKVAEEDGCVVLHVAGADMMDGTPVIDIKPYVPYADSVPDARGGFAEEKKAHALQVILPEELRARIPAEDVPAVLAILAQDPRPAYQHQPERVYGVPYGENDIRFTVDGDTLTVTDVVPYEKIITGKDET